MKFGVRKVNVKSRIKAKTTSQVKRAINREINPLYGKKGMGLINNPEKSIYNKVYNKTTISADDLLDSYNDENFSDEIQYFRVNDGSIENKHFFKKFIKIFFEFINAFIILYAIVTLNLVVLALEFYWIYKKINKYRNKKEL